MEPVFEEVHRSNLSKVGGYKRADGKWVKPATYSPACIDPILNIQREQSLAGELFAIGTSPEPPHSP
jgi:predicted HAD superfamily Cof-like phosphohydrolase